MKTTYLYLPEQKKARAKLDNRQDEGVWRRWKDVHRTSAARVGVTMHERKENNSRTNLATACRRCNSKANYNREEWRARFRAAIGVT